MLGPRSGPWSTLALFLVGGPGERRERNFLNPKFRRILQRKLDIQSKFPYHIAYDKRKEDPVSCCRWNKLAAFLRQPHRSLSTFDLDAPLPLELVGGPGEWPRDAGRARSRK